MLDPTHGYSVGGTYRFLTSAEEPMAHGDYNDVWHKLVPSKVSIFAWRLLQNRILTKSNLVRRLALQPQDNLCGGGCGSIETAYHLFLGCNVFRQVWLGISFVCPGHIKDHYIQFTHLAGLPRASYYYLKVMWLASIWVIWKDRNNCIFKNTVIDPHSMLDKVKRSSFLWLSSNSIPLDFSFHDWWRHPLLCIGVM